VDYARYINFAFSFGVTMVLSLLLGFYGGRWLDQKLGTEPLFLVAGLLLGVFVSFTSLLAELKVLETTKEPGGTGDDETHK